MGNGAKLAGFGGGGGIGVVPKLRCNRGEEFRLGKESHGVHSRVFSGADELGEIYVSSEILFARRVEQVGVDGVLPIGAQSAVGALGSEEFVCQQTVVAGHQPALAED